MSSNTVSFSTNTSNISTEMRIWERKFLLFLIDAVLLISILFFTDQFFSPELDLISFLKDNFFSFFYCLFLFLILGFTFNLYDIEFVNKTRKVLPVSFFIGITCTSLYLLTARLNPSLHLLKVPVFNFMAGFTASLILWRVFYAAVIHENLFIKKFILLTAENFNKENIQQIKNSIEGEDHDHDIKISRIYQVPAKKNQLNELSETLERITDKKLVHGVIILNHDQEFISRSLNSILVNLMGKGIQVTTYLELFEEIKEALPIEFAGDQFYNILPISKSNQNYFYLLWHKILNLITSLLGLTLMIVLTPFILVLNIFLNKGPLFYKQQRVGKGGEDIVITKFRSMIVGAEKHGAKMSAIGDKRITSFGRIMRNFRIDELPQFWSVLIGDMSFIGPRPERRIFIDQLIDEIPVYDARHLVKPGITGWAQVKYGYGANTKDSLKKLEYDLYYIKNRSITLDIRIIFKTINTIAFFKGH